MPALLALAQRPSTDTAEAACACLAALTWQHDASARAVLRAGGVAQLVALCSDPRAAELATAQGGAAETLANVTRLVEEPATAGAVVEAGVESVVLLCASTNVSVRRHAATVLGNIAQDDELRVRAGDAGAIEALFLAADSRDAAVAATAVWAAGNLAWSVDNQNRLGRYLPQLLRLALSPAPAVQAAVITALANALHYHDPNRVVLLRQPGALDVLARFARHASPAVRAHTARAIGALAYNAAASAAVAAAGLLSAVVALCRAPEAPVQRFAAYAAANLAVLDANKRQLLEVGAVEALVALCVAREEETRGWADAALRIMSSDASQDELARRREQFGVRGLVALLRHGDGNPLVHGLAAETIAQQLYERPGAQHDEVGAAQGVEALLALCRGATDRGVLARALWALRNALHCHAENQDAFFALDGVALVLRLVDWPPSSAGSAPAAVGDAAAAAGAEAAPAAVDEEVAEAALLCLVNACLGHTRNSRQLLVVGLERLLALVEAAKARSVTDRQRALSTTRSSRAPGSPARSRVSAAASSQRSVPSRRAAGGSTARHTADAAAGRAAEAGSEAGDAGGDNPLAELARDLLQIIGPHSWLLCGNCGERQPGGRVCVQCGHRLEFKVSNVGT